MNIDVLLAQFLVLAFTGILWWLARRDLSARSGPNALSKGDTAPSDTTELEQLCATLEMLVTRLSQRLDAVEYQLEAVQSSRVSECPSVLSAALVSVSEVLVANPEVSVTHEVPPPGVFFALPEVAPPEVAPPPLVVSVLPEPAPAPNVLPSHVLPSHVLPSHVLPNAGFSGSISDPHSAPVYALFDGGTTDPVEIARRTGLGRGEVDLILSLRARHTG